MKRLLIGSALALLLGACELSGNITAMVETPLCPISDSAWAATDYAPLGCVKP